MVYNKTRLMMMLAEVVELADAPDSKSGVGDNVWVQVPPSAPNLKVADNFGYQLLFLREHLAIG